MESLFFLYNLILSLFCICSPSTAPNYSTSVRDLEPGVCSPSVKTHIPTAPGAPKKSTSVSARRAVNELSGLSEVKKQLMPQGQATDSLVCPPAPRKPTPSSSARLYCRDDMASPAPVYRRLVFDADGYDNSDSLPPLGLQSSFLRVKHADVLGLKPFGTQGNKSGGTSNADNNKSTSVCSLLMDLVSDFGVFEDSIFIMLCLCAQTNDTTSSKPMHSSHSSNDTHGNNFHSSFGQFARHRLSHPKQVWKAADNDGHMSDGP